MSLELELAVLRDFCERGLILTFETVAVGGVRGRVYDARWGVATPRSVRRMKRPILRPATRGEGR